VKRRRRHWGNEGGESVRRPAVRAASRGTTSRAAATSPTNDGTEGEERAGAENEVDFTGAAEMAETAKEGAAKRGMEKEVANKHMMERRVS
jgi:hypothetical protein